MSKFAPVFLPEGAELNGRVNMGFLRHYNSCPRSAYLAQIHKKHDARTVPMERGRAFHEVAERTIKLMMEMHEPIVPADVAKAILAEVLAESEFAVPIEEHDILREAVWRWSSELAIDPMQVVACETLFTLRVGGYEVRCRVDLAQLTDEGEGLVIQDWKTGRSAPAYDDISRKRADGSLMAKNLQLILYSLALVYGTPVREEIADGERVEIQEPFPVAQRAQHVEAAFVYPGIEDRDGKMLRRPVTLTRLELEEYRGSLESILHRLARSEETGDWPAVVSDEACGICPASSECPIPSALRDLRGELRSVEEAAAAAELLDRTRAEMNALQREVKAVAKREGVPIRFGLDKCQDFTVQEARKVDTDGLEAAVERFQRDGQPFDFSDFVKVSTSTPFKVRTLSADELEQEAAGGVSGAGNGGRDDRAGRGTDAAV